MELLSVLLFAAVGFAAGGIAIALLNWGRVRHAEAAVRAAAHRELAGLKEILESKQAELDAARARLEQQGGELADLVAQSQHASDTVAAGIAERTRFEQRLADSEDCVRRLQQEIQRLEYQLQREASAREAEVTRRTAAEQRSGLLEAQLSAESQRYGAQHWEVEALRAKLAELLTPRVAPPHGNGNGSNGHVLLLAPPAERETPAHPPPGSASAAAPPNPEPARVCLFCGSSRNVEDGCLSGRSDHLAADDRIPACRACNNRFGMTFRRIGLGRRSRLAGPQGARSLGQWASALASVKGDACSMPLAEAVGMIRSTPPDKRSRFTEELWGRRRK